MLLTLSRNEEKNSGDLQQCLALSAEKSHQPAPDEMFRVRHDAIDQLLDGRDIVDETDDHAAAPRASIHVAIDHDLGVDPGDLVMDIFDLELGALLALDLQQTVDAGIFQ